MLTKKKSSKGHNINRLEFHLKLSLFHCPEMVELKFTGHLYAKIPNIYIYGAIQVQLSLFVKICTFPEQIAIIGMFSKFRIFSDCACSQRANSPRDII